MTEREKLGTSKLSVKKQARIPDDVLDYLNAEEGDILVFLNNKNARINKIEVIKGRVDYE